MRQSRRVITVCAGVLCLQTPFFVYVLSFLKRKYERKQFGRSFRNLPVVQGGAFLPRQLHQSKGGSAVRILKCFQLCGAFISVWTGESEGLFSCIAFLGRRLRLSRWESSRRSRVRGVRPFFVLPPLRRTSRATALFSAKPARALRTIANLPSSRRSLQGCFAPLAYPPFSAKPARVLRTACISPRKARLKRNEQNQ